MGGKCLKKEVCCVILFCEGVTPRILNNARGKSTSCRAKKVRLVCQ